LLIDIGKGIVAVTLLPEFGLFGLGLDAEVSRDLVLYSVAFAVILGHVYPLWYAFKGGKGGATAAGVLCALAPPVGIAIIIVWLIVVIASGYVGLATMAAAIAAAVYVATTVLPEQAGLFAFTVATAALIIYTHRSNIQRMRHGTEVRMGPLHRGR
jgi:glycerol-3-phosphate acyltransferase PlsY